MRRLSSTARHMHDRAKANRDRGTGIEHRAEGAQGERVMSAEEQMRSNVTSDGAAVSGHKDVYPSAALADQPPPVSGGSLLLVLVVVLLIAVGLGVFGILE